MSFSDEILSKDFISHLLPVNKQFMPVQNNLKQNL